MASSPITSWQIDGETMETMRGFIFLGSKITAGGDCSYEIKRRLLLGRKAMTNLDSILNSSTWPPDMKNWLVGKDPHAGKDWRQEEKGRTEDEMVGWNHRLNGEEFEQAPGVGDGQGSLACCSPWDCKELDMTEQLNWTEYDWLGLPGGASGKVPTCQGRRHKKCGFNPSVRKIP